MKRFKAGDFKAIETYHKANELLENSNVHLCKSTGDMLTLSTDFFTGSDFADLPEISVSAEYKHCERCEMRKKCITSIRAKNKICYICSLTCLKEFLEVYSDFVIQHLKGANNFYPDRCLFCRKVVSANCVIAMMQRFCNVECLDMHQRRYFNSCFLCQKSVDEKEMGRFCFYRNQRMFQLCGPDCQETFKQHKTCQFCGQSLKEQEMLSVFVSKSRKNFCNAECHTKFQSHSEETDVTKRHCGICQATDLNEHYIVIELKICKLFACSRVCFYIFFEMNSMICGKVVEPYHICMYCRKLFLRNNESTIAFNKKCHLFRFCSEICKWILIWSQSRERFGNCDTCLAKKHFYDFIYFREEDQCQAFCSIYCYKVKQKMAISDQSFQVKTVTSGALLQSQTAIYLTGMNSASGSSPQISQPANLPKGSIMRLATPLNVSLANGSDKQPNGSSLKQLLLLNTSKTLRQIRPAPPPAVNPNQLIQPQGALKTVPQVQNVTDPPQSSFPKAVETVKKTVSQVHNVTDPPQSSSPKAVETVKKCVPQVKNGKDPPKLTKLSSQKSIDETIKKPVRNVPTREIGVQTDFEDLEVKKDCQDKGTQTCKFFKILNRISGRKNDLEAAIQLKMADEISQFGRFCFPDNYRCNESV